MSKLSRFVLAMVFSVVLWGGNARAAEPVDIVYGYHPYWTGGWNGVIIKDKGLWKKYLPKGSKVRFEAHLTGPPMVNALLADKMQIGTMGDMPSLVATTKRKRADVRLVSVPMYSMGQNCNKMLVRKDAPDFKSVKEAMAWLNGKPFAVHRGTCANRFVESVIEKGGFKPTKVLSMAIEVISSNFEAGKLDAAAMWEPHARRAVERGHAKYVATGAPWNEADADFTLMRQDFIEKHPEAAIGWMKAEIEAVRFMAQNPKETAEILAAEVTGYPKVMAWKALYEKNPAAIGGTKYNYIGKVVFDKDVIKLMNDGYAFLYRKKVLKSPDAPLNAYNDMPINTALKEMGLTAPVAKIEGMAKPPVF